MSFFACAINRVGGPVPASFRTNVESSPFREDMELEWYSMTGFAAAVGLRDGIPTASIARHHNVIAIGNVRLDNRLEIARCCSDVASYRSDLELALHFVLQDDGARVGRLLGDFAFVAWDPTRLALLAVRDTFGIQKLFHSTPAAAVSCFASHASLLASKETYDLKYLADRVCRSRSDPSRTVFAAVSAVPPASMLRMLSGRSTLVTYWSAAEAQRETVPPSSPEQQCEQFRSLLVESVRLALTDGAPTWSQLSGGLDSSSVACIAQWLAARGEVAYGLAGTVTYTDSLGTGADELEYAKAVVQQYGIRSELVPHRADVDALLDDLPVLDQPDLPYTVAFRDRLAARLIQRAGGHTLLTGEGGDSLVAGTMFFFADWLVTGRVWAAVREMAHRSALGHVSFWTLAYENALLPVLPAPLRRQLTRSRTGSIPPWIPRPAARRMSLTARGLHDQVYRGRLGCKYTDAVVATVAAIPSAMPSGPLDASLERRHPYLHRPLVELALRLPPSMCVRPHARKWILREAMRGIVPEHVRTRVGKGALDGLNLWQLTHDRGRLDPLLRDPILAQLGCLDVRRFRTILDEVRSGRQGYDGWRDRISSTLEVELWLRLRSGRWAAADAQSTTSHHARAGMACMNTLNGQSSRSFV